MVQMLLLVQEKKQDHFEDYLNSLRKDYNNYILPVYFDFNDQTKIKEAVKI